MEGRLGLLSDLYHGVQREPLSIKAYRPSQPREPKGTRGGGRWSGREKVERARKALPRLRSDVSARLDEPALSKRWSVGLVIALIDRMKARIGDSSNNKDGTFGISNVTRDFAEIRGDKLILKYPGKHGVEQRHETVDPVLLKGVRTLLRAGKGRTDRRLFFYENRYGEPTPVSGKMVRNVMAEYGIRPHDVRHLHANRALHRELLKRRRAAKTDRDRKRLLKEAAEVVARKLGNEPRTVLRYYVDPALIEAWTRGRYSKSLVKAYRFEESRHHRWPKGSPQGGQFAPFHGTTSGNLKEIVASGKLGQDPSKTKKTMWKNPSDVPGLYVSARLGVAESYAHNAVQKMGGHKVIVAVKSAAEDRLVADDDSLPEFATLALHLQMKRELEEQGRFDPEDGWGTGWMEHASSLGDALTDVEEDSTPLMQDKSAEKAEAFLREHGVHEIVDAWAKKHPKAYEEVMQYGYTNDNSAFIELGDDLKDVYYHNVPFTYSESRNRQHVIANEISLDRVEVALMEVEDEVRRIRRTDLTVVMKHLREVLQKDGFEAAKEWALQYELQDGYVFPLIDGWAVGSQTNFRIGSKWSAIDQKEHYWIEEARRKRVGELEVLSVTPLKEDVPDFTDMTSAAKFATQLHAEREKPGTQFAIKAHGPWLEWQHPRDEKGRFSEKDSHVSVVHYSQRDLGDSTWLSPGAYGTGKAGEEKSRVQYENAPQRTYVYAAESRHERKVTSGAKAKYIGRIPRGLPRIQVRLGEGPTGAERRMLEEGYPGYRAAEGAAIDAYAMFESVPADRAKNALVGMTAFRNAEETPDLVEAYKNSGLDGFRAITEPWVRSNLDAPGVVLEHLGPAHGVWEGVLEPSHDIRIAVSDRTILLGRVAQFGRAFNQDSVLVSYPATPGEEGAHESVKLSVSGEVTESIRDTFLRAMQEVGLPGATIGKDFLILHTLGFDPEEPEKVARIVEKLSPLVGAGMRLDVLWFKHDLIGRDGYDEAIAAGAARERHKLHWERKIDFATRGEPAVKAFVAGWGTRAP